MKNKFNLAVIGSGPGGYVAAIRAAQLGMKVACIEKSELGGICLNWGCIPTKSLIKNADVWRNLQSLDRFGISCENPQLDFSKVIQRSRQVSDRLSKGVEFLFNKNQITVFNGFGRFRDKNTVEVLDSENNILSEIAADSIIIATGARTRSIHGVEIDGERVISSHEAMILPEVPKSIIVIGAGTIGVEFAYIFRSFGSEVNIVELLPQILSIEDEDISRELTRSFKKQGIGIFTDTKVENIITKESSVEVFINKNSVQKTLYADFTLMAIGVRANVENIGLKKIGMELDSGWIKVNDDYETNVSGVYAIGDVIGNPCLAHVASAEGIHTVEKIAGQNPQPVNYEAIPACTYCKPQVASVGLTEEKAVEKGLEIAVGKFHFRANGKGLAFGEIDGFVKVIFDSTTDQLVGAHIIGSEATELIPELTLAITNKMTFDEVKNSIHAHPTLSEAVMEAVLDAYGKAIHK